MIIELCKKNLCLAGNYRDVAQISFDYDIFKVTLVQENAC